VEALDHADFELQERQGELLDGQKRVVGKPAGYVFNALCRAGYYRRPEGFVSAAEQAERDAAEEAKRVCAARKEREEAEAAAVKAREDAEFAAWQAGLSTAERDEIVRQGLPSPERVKLLFAWKKQREESARAAQAQPSGEGQG
jgi:hypothetical protein